MTRSAAIIRPVVRHLTSYFGSRLIISLITLIRSQVVFVRCLTSPVPNDDCTVNKPYDSFTMASNEADDARYFEPRCTLAQRSPYLITQRFRYTSQFANEEEKKRSKNISQTAVCVRKPDVYFILVGAIHPWIEVLLVFVFLAAQPLVEVVASEGGL